MPACMEFCYQRGSSSADHLQVVVAVYRASRSVVTCVPLSVFERQTELLVDVGIQFNLL